VLLIRRNLSCPTRQCWVSVGSCVFLTVSAGYTYDLVFSHVSSRYPYDLVLSAVSAGVSVRSGVFVTVRV